ncbi:MAG: translation elongation factor Ts [Treponema sp.]|jgi:elongation factor Ts|nr:translation elongation factor Ts [Treponema sp.]
MAEISAADVKRLREKTGAGMMECKNALAANGGDFDKAEKYLKEKGLAAIEKRAGRATNEGRIFVKTREDNSAAVLVEVASETDFVARNPEFIALGEVIAEKALERECTGPDPELSGMVTDLATKIRENMSLKRVKFVKAAEGGYLVQYIHGDGNIGVVVSFSSANPEIFSREDVRAFAFTIALHVAAFNPMALSRDKMDPAFLKEQEDIYRKQMEGDEKLKDKPSAVIDNILKGKINKYLADACLLEQSYVKDDKITVEAALAECGKKAGSPVEIAGYAYFKVGG